MDRAAGTLLGASYVINSSLNTDSSCLSAIAIVLVLFTDASLLNPTGRRDETCFAQLKWSLLVKGKHTFRKFLRI
jgi:hypothetical protein